MTKTLTNLTTCKRILVWTSAILAMLLLMLSVDATPSFAASTTRQGLLIATEPDTSNGLAAPLANCHWVTVSGTAWTNQNLNMNIELLGQFDASGHYCGLASDHICATPTNNHYYPTGLKIFNWWYADGNYIRTTQSFFNAASGTTYCNYSGTFTAIQAAEADGKFVDVAAATITTSIVGQKGVHATFV